MRKVFGDGEFSRKNQIKSNPALRKKTPDYHNEAEWLTNHNTPDLKISDKILKGKKASSRSQRYLWFVKAVYEENKLWVSKGQ